MSGENTITSTIAVISHGKRFVFSCGQARAANLRALCATRDPSDRGDPFRRRLCHRMAEAETRLETRAAALH